MFGFKHTMCKKERRQIYILLDYRLTSAPYNQYVDFYKPHNRIFVTLQLLEHKRQYNLNQ